MIKASSDPGTSTAGQAGPAVAPRTLFFFFLQQVEAPASFSQLQPRRGGLQPPPGARPRGRCSCYRQGELQPVWMAAHFEMCSPRQSCFSPRSVSLCRLASSHDRNSHFPVLCLWSVPSYALRAVPAVPSDQLLLTLADTSELLSSSSSRAPTLGHLWLSSLLCAPRAAPLSC